MLIHDYDKTELPSVRFHYGKTAGILGILSNILLFAAKLAVGIIGGSITIIADAVNNLSDAGSSVVTLLGFKLSSKPADREHPYGHARYEYITGLLVSVLVLAIGIMLGKSSIEKIITPEVITVNTLTYVVLGISIAAKLAQMALYSDFGNAIDSATLKASAADSRNDSIATTAVLISTIVIDLSGVNIDGYMGVAVSVFIIVSSIQLIRDTINPILGTIPDKALVDEITHKILSYDGVLGIHDLMVHTYGAVATYAIAHVEVSASVDVMVSHDLIDNIERDFLNDLHIHLSIHMDPIETGNDEVAELKARAITVIHSLEKDLTLHDFRMVKGVTHTNLLFDVVVPYSSTLDKATIIRALNAEFNPDGNSFYYFVITIDNNYVM